MISSLIGRLPGPLRPLAQEVWARRFGVGGFVLGVAALAVVVALLLKPWFAAEATLLPPTESGDSFLNLTGLIESSALSRVGLFSTQTPSDIYVEILKSRRLREALVRKFDLQRRYDMKHMDGALKELDKHFVVDAAPSGVVILRIEDQDKQRAADMTNFMVNELDRFNRETLQTRGKRTRIFLDQRLAELSRRMQKAESTLTAYERTNKVVLATDDASVRGMADVVSRKLDLQVRRAYISSYAPNSPSVREIDAEIEAFERELSRLPELKNEGARIALEATIQRKLFTLLTAQYEDARVQEMRDTPTVTVLDWARPPDIRARPKRTVMVVLATVIAFVLSVARIAFITRRRPA